MKLVLGVALALITSSSSAQDIEMKLAYNSLLSLSFEELMAVKVTGSTLTPKSQTQVPAAVTSFNRQQIARLGLDTLDELMNLVAGFQAYRSGGSSVQSQYSVRGRRSGVSSAEILILIDGQRLDDPRSSGSGVVAPKIPLAMIEKVEFIRGSGSAIYGSNAMMGLINIVTRTGVNQVDIGLGNFGRVQTSLMTSATSGDWQWDLFARLEQDSGQDYLLENNFSPELLPSNDPRKGHQFNFKLKHKNTLLSFQQYDSKAENFYEQSTLNNQVNQRKASFSAIALEQQFNMPNIDASLRLSLADADVFTQAQLTPMGALAPISNPTSNQALIASGDFNDYRESRLLWHNNWLINNQQSLQFGLEWRQIDAPLTLASNNFDLGDLSSGQFPIRYYGEMLETTPVQAESQRDILAIYAQYQRALGKNIELLLGARYDHFSQIGGQLSPKAALVWQANKQQSLKLIYGEAFRAPSEFELNLQNNLILLGNQQLQPETVQSWELIWLGQWRKSRVALGLFSHKFSDAILQQPIGGNLTQYSNQPLASNRGAEFELSYQLNSHWLLEANMSYLFDKAPEFLLEADTLASLIINYQKDNWNVNFSGSYHAERQSRTQGALPLASYWEAFAKVNYQISDNWQGYLQVKNLFDENYLAPANQVLVSGIPARGREILLSAVWLF